jgi:hypothetical protein
MRLSLAEASGIFVRERTQNGDSGQTGRKNVEPGLSDGVSSGFRALLRAVAARWPHTLCLAWLLLSGCAANETRLPGFRQRVVESTDGPLTVSVAALNPVESAEVYGRPLAALGVQPVWIEVENRDSAAYRFLPLGLDPGYFPYWEVAEGFALGVSDRISNAERARFESLALPRVIPPGSTVSGFVFTNAGEAFKFVHTDFLRSGRLRHMSMLVDVPGFHADYEQQRQEREAIWSAPTTDFGEDREAFRRALEDLPCCVTNRKGTKNGDPLNLVIVGDRADAFPALARRGWRATETTWAGSVWRTMASALSGEPYPYAPVSPLYLFDRVQDFALQKARDNIHQRNHLRLWLAPFRYRGRPVWVGQISRDIGSRLTIHSPYLTTHKIDPDVDEARAALAEDMVYTRQLRQIGWVGGVGAAPRQEPAGNLTGDPYFTDGSRLVLIFDADATRRSDIQWLPWDKVDVRGDDVR